MKRLFFCIALFFGVIVCANAGPAIAGAERSETWVVYKYPGTKYPLLYLHDECSIKVSADKTEVWIQAYDLSWEGEHLQQTLVLKKKADGTLSIAESQTQTYRYSPAFIGIVEVRGYDIFFENCIELVKYLPLSTQEIIYAYYGPRPE